MADMIEKTKVFREERHGGGLPDDPFGYLEYDHKAQRGVADLLEAIADSLPDGVRPATATLAASLLRDSVQRRVALEEEAFVPLIDRRFGPGSTQERALELARRDRQETVGRAIELAEELDILAIQGEVTNPDALGFMLRAYFDGLRRHLDWVEVAILNDLRVSVSPDDLAALGAQLLALRESARIARWSGLTLVVDGG